MPRAPDYELAEKDYMLGMKYKDIAEKYGVSINTVKSWKQRYNWSRKKDAHKEKGVHTKKKHGGQPGNRGNPNPPNQFTERNKAAEKHGFFSKWMPEETLEIMQEIKTKPAIDLLWDNIIIQYTAIVRAQKIMFVKDKEEMIKELKKRRFEVKNVASGGEKDYRSIPTEEEYEFQFAWDRQATFLKAQSRAMGELRSMIKQFTELADNDDHRLLELKKINATITKTEKETEFIEEKTKLIKGEKKDTSLLEALIKVVNEDE